jgi:hypothetical protein
MNQSEFRVKSILPAADVPFKICFNERSEFNIPHKKNAG